MIFSRVNLMILEEAELIKKRKKERKRKKEKKMNKNIIITFSLFIIRQINVFQGKDQSGYSLDFNKLPTRPHARDTQTIVITCNSVLHVLTLDERVLLSVSMMIMIKSEKQKRETLNRPTTTLPWGRTRAQTKKKPLQVIPGSKFNT